VCIKFYFQIFTNDEKGKKWTSLFTWFCFPVAADCRKKEENYKTGKGIKSKYQHLRQYLERFMII
jgi:hypothetical protein